MTQQVLVVTQTQTLVVHGDGVDHELVRSVPVFNTLLGAGSQGPPGPQGRDGVGDANYEFTQATPAAVWAIAHNLNKFPSVTVLDSSGDECEGVVQYTSRNHSGTQTASTISDFTATATALRLDQFAAPTASVPLNSQKITGMADGTAAQDAATFGQVSALLNGRTFKDAVRCASTTNVATLSGLLTVDGITVVAGDRVLLAGQTTGSQNGIYVAASGAWTRATDADSATADAELKAGTTVFVNEGTANGDKQFSCTTNGSITVGTTATTWAITGAGTTYTAGTGISIAGSVISVDTAVVTRKFSGDVGDGSATAIAVTHNLGTSDVQVQVYDKTSLDTVECDVVRTSTNVVTVTFAVAPTSAQYRVVVQG
jgi:hypothetical protein